MRALGKAVLNELPSSEALRQLVVKAGKPDGLNVPPGKDDKRVYLLFRIVFCFFVKI